MVTSSSAESLAKFSSSGSELTSCAVTSTCGASGAVKATVMDGRVAPAVTPAGSVRRHVSSTSQSQAGPETVSSSDPRVPTPANTPGETEVPVPVLVTTTSTEAGAPAATDAAPSTATPRSDP